MPRSLLQPSHASILCIAALHQSQGNINTQGYTNVLAGFMQHLYLTCLTSNLCCGQEEQS